MNQFWRDDGTEHDDERRLGFGVFLDHLLPIVAVGLLAWLCIGQVTLQNKVAILLERTQAQNGRVEAMGLDLVRLHSTDADLQRQISEIRVIRGPSPRVFPSNGNTPP